MNPSCLTQHGRKGARKKDGGGVVDQLQLWSLDGVRLPHFIFLGLIHGIAFTILTSFMLSLCHVCRRPTHSGKGAAARRDPFIAFFNYIATPRFRSTR